MQILHSVCAWAKFLNIRVVRWHPVVGNQYSGELEQVCWELQFLTAMFVCCIGFWETEIVVHFGAFLTEPPPQGAHFRSRFTFRASSGKSTWQFSVFSMEVLEEKGIRDVVGCYPACFSGPYPPPQSVIYFSLPSFLQDLRIALIVKSGCQCPAVWAVLNVDGSACSGWAGLIYTLLIYRRIL